MSFWRQCFWMLCLFGVLGSGCVLYAANTIPEASRLLEEAVRIEYSDEMILEISSGRPERLLSKQLSLLEKALDLDPGLPEAHYWLGSLLARKYYSGASSVQIMTGVERAIRELELFLKDSRSDGLVHNMSLTSEAMSRAPGALHEKAQCQLIWSYHQLWLLVDVNIDNPVYKMTAAERGEWRGKADPVRRRLVELVERYMREPPRKHMPDHIYELPLIVARHRDPKNPTPWIDWFLFVDKIYGKEHGRYNVICPYMRLGRELLTAGKPELALKYFEQGMKEHQHRVTDMPDATLQEIYAALGKPDKAKEIQDAVDGKAKR